MGVSSKRADQLIREALRSARGEFTEWSGRETKRADYAIRRRMLGEAADGMENVDAVMARYHYVVDPRHKNQQDGDRWYVNESGHQAFVYPDPTFGVKWHHYESKQKSAFKSGDREQLFRKGSGVPSLAEWLSTLHTPGVG